MKRIEFHQRGLLYPVMCFMLLISSFSFAQTDYQVTYAYDTAGNRVSRTSTIVFKSATMEGNDSISFSAEELEKTIKQNEKFESYDGEYKFTLYPNPTHGRLILSISPFSDDLPGSTIQLFDIGGKLLLTKKVESSIIEINLSDYHSGDYLLTLDSKGDCKNWKIIKK